MIIADWNSGVVSTDPAELELRQENAVMSELFG